jgi:hypothetical protein
MSKLKELKNDLESREYSKLSEGQKRLLYELRLLDGKGLLEEEALEKLAESSFQHGEIVRKSVGMGGDSCPCCGK